jgi:alkanesulfonate monooxygenase SsuD/methylene tetrahydromethanopterin reductase-like flavin-dependent oxidoreductase (luciferase family)
MEGASIPTDGRPFGAAPTAGRPRLGLSLSFQSRPDLGETFSTAYGESLELAAEADRLGVDDIWLSEHHGEADGYCPSPVVAAAAVAGVTRRARICLGISLAPLHGHPLRLAEDLAVVDNLSGGRIEPGFGQGYRPQEFQALGLPFERRTRLLGEALDVLDLAWSGDRFDYHGEIHRVDGGLLRPAPVRPGLPPLWLGAATPRSRARAVRRRAGLMIASLTSAEHTARQFASFDAEVERTGVGALPHALAREIEVGDSDEDARVQIAPFLDHIYRVQYSAERTGLTRLDPDTGERRPLASNDPFYLSPEFLDERWAIGSPDTVVHRINDWIRLMRIDRLVLHKLAGRSLADSVRAIERVAGEVWPRIGDAPGTDLGTTS